jgi:hypothetical protein
METLTTIISFLLLLGLISVPILLFVGIKKWYRLKFNFLTYLISGLIITAGIMWIFAWWTDYSNILLLKHYNGYVYNPDSDGYQIEYDNVLPENLERVKSLEIRVMGIGWSLKAIMSFVFYSPYLLIVYGVGQLIRRVKRKNKEHAPNTK